LAQAVYFCIVFHCTDFRCAIDAMARLQFHICLAVLTLQFAGSLGTSGPLGELAKTVESVKEKVGNPTPNEVVKDIKNGISAVRSNAEDIVNNSAGKEAEEQLPTTEQVTEAVEKAKDQGAEAISDAASSAQASSPEDTASELRKATPKAVEALNTTSSQLADGAEHVGSQAAALVNRTSHKLADSISEPTKSSSDLPGLKSSGRAIGTASCLAFMGIMLCCAVTGTRVRNSMSARRPVLLQDTLMGEVV